MSQLPTVPELARQLGCDATVMRSWMRRQGWRSRAEHGQRWLLTAEQVAILTSRYRPGECAPEFSGAETDGTDATDATDGTDLVDSDDSAADAATPLALLSVGDLLSTYSDVLAELRSRHLVRTNNAPIGDLAEYCAAEVYDGLLAPNSEKSFDLTAADERRIQVKVRQTRPDTSRSAVFSPIRSFDFDLAVFIVIDAERNEVIAAREWTAEEVRAHGSYKKHTNGTVLTLSKILAKSARGEDRTADFAEAWASLLQRTRAGEA